MTGLVPAVPVTSGTGGTGWEPLLESLDSAGWAVVWAQLADWQPVAERPPGPGAPHRGPSRRAARHLSAASRALLRCAAAMALGTDPELMEVARTPTGRPYLRGEERMSVSIGHTGDLLVVGLSRLGPIGVDVELGTRRVHGSGLEREICTAHERAGLARLPDAERNAALVRLWTLKEAYSKAMGLGLRLPFGDFGFAPVTAGHGQPPTLRHADGTPATADGWWFGTRSLPHPATVAVAVSR